MVFRILEAATAGALSKKVFLNILQNSQETTYARVSSLIKLQGRAQKEKKRLWHRCFSVNLAKYLGKTFLQNTSERLLLVFHIKQFENRLE